MYKYAYGGAWMEVHEIMKKPIIKLKEQDDVQSGIQKMLKKQSQQSACCQR